MIKRLHTQSKVFFKNPYVVRVSHSDFAVNAYDNSMVGYRSMVKHAREVMGGTWGYSQVRYEYDVVNSDPEVTKCFTGTIKESFKNWRSYWVFADELDALQFTLSVGNGAKRVHMWPNNTKFTITEIIDNAISG